MIQKLKRYSKQLSGSILHDRRLVSAINDCLSALVLRAKGGTKQRINNFDWLRLFLALEVVYTHAHAFTHTTAYALPVDPVPGFVALSGFLIPGSFGSSENWKHFAWKRITRVYPAFAASLVLVFALAGWNAMLPTMLGYLSIGLIQMHGGGNGALWSLMLEEILYGSHVGCRLRRLWTAEIAAGLAVACIALALALHGDNTIDRIFRAAAAYFLGNLAYFNKARITSTRLIVPAFLASVLASYLVPLELWGLVVPTVGILAVLSVVTLPQIPFAVPADISYGLYIYHVPILGYLVFLRRSPNAVFLTFVFSVAISVASAYLIEQPALKYKNRLPRLQFWKARRPEVLAVEPA